MKQIFDELGLEITVDNKRIIDKHIHGILGVDYKNCSATWKEVKNRLAEDEAGFLVELKKFQNILRG
ncbi:MAG: hypothetical protein ACTSU3_02280 [Candidatus Thorarchaeota archaeon]